MFFKPVETRMAIDDSPTVVVLACFWLLILTPAVVQGLVLIYDKLLFAFYDRWQCRRERYLPWATASPPLCLLLLFGGVVYAAILFGKAAGGGDSGHCE